MSEEKEKNNPEKEVSDVPNAELGGEFELRERFGGEDAEQLQAMQRDMDRLQELQVNERELIELGSELSKEQKNETIELNNSLIEKAKGSLASFIKSARERIPSATKIVLGGTAILVLVTSGTFTDAMKAGKYDMDKDVWEPTEKAVVYVLSADHFKNFDKEFERHGLELSGPDDLEEVSIDEDKTPLEKIESHFQIEFVTPNELASLDYKGSEVSVVEWSEAQMASLKNTLSELPPHFYEPHTGTVKRIVDPSSPKPDWITAEKWMQGEHEFHKDFLKQTRSKVGENYNISFEDFQKARAEKGYIELEFKSKPVEFVLVDETNIPPEVKSVAFCSCHDVDNPRIVTRSDQIVGPESEYDFRLMTHELTHRLTHPELNDYSNDFFQKMGLAGLGEIQDRFDSELVREKSGDFWIVKGYKSHLGYGATKIGEFFSVAAENYISGEDHFRDTYEPFFDDEQVDIFYQFIRNEIFWGKEYSAN